MLLFQVDLFDKFFHPKKKLHSHAYRIVYRSPDRTLSQEEVNKVHKKIEEEAARLLGVKIR